MKKKYIIGGILLVIIIAIIIVFNIFKDDNLISKTKTINGIKFSDAKITKLNDMYIFKVTVTTTSKNNINVEDFDATIYDKKGNRLETLTGYVGDIDSNSKKEITIESKEDLSDAYEINYTLRINND